MREGEARTALLMFAYSFLAMTSYNIIQPITRSRFISDLGAANIPYVQFAAGFLVGIIMQGYSRVTALLPRKWVIPLSQAALVGILVLFWVLFQTGQQWVSVGVLPPGAYFRHSPRQPVLDAGQRRLRRATGQAAVRVHRRWNGPRRDDGRGHYGAHRRARRHEHAAAVQRGHPGALHLHRDGGAQTRRRGAGQPDASAPRRSRARARARRSSCFSARRQMQLIAVIITMGALGAAILDQQLNMATEAFRGGAGPIP